MNDPMLAKLEHLTGRRTGSRPGSDDDAPLARPLDWAALRARLRAERELRASLMGEPSGPRESWYAAFGSFDPRAAEALYAQCHAADLPVAPKRTTGPRAAKAHDSSHLPDAKRSGAMPGDPSFAADGAHGMSRTG